MPVGLVVMRWDERVGTEILAKYPEEIIVTDKTLMQVYSTHEYSGDSGLISLMVGALNIASYYTGRDKGFYILLLLNLDDDPDSYEGGLADIATTILQNLEDDAYLPLIPTLFRRVSVFPNLNKEQRLAMTYEDDIKRMIIDRLRDEGVVAKSELIVWLKDKYKHGFVDLEAVLIELIKRELIKETSVKGMPSELIFLTKDVLMLRMLPMSILNNPTEKGLPSQLEELYKSEVKKFFRTYRPTEKDNLEVINLLTNPEAYETLRLLRTAVVTKNELEKLKKKGVEDIDGVLSMLWNAQMIQVFQDDQNNEYYALICDFYLDVIFPKYQMSIIKAEYDQKSKSEEVLIEYLNVLKDFYLGLQKEKKQEDKSEKKAEKRAASKKVKSSKKSRKTAEKALEKARKAEEKAREAKEKARLARAAL